MKIIDATQSVEVSLDRGDVEVHASKSPLPKMDLKTRNGDVTVAIPEGSKFVLRGRTEHGEAQNEFGDAVKVESDERSASVSARSGDGPEIVLNTNRGTIVVRRATGEMMARPPAVEGVPPPPRPPKGAKPPKPPASGELRGEKT